MAKKARSAAAKSPRANKAFKFNCYKKFAAIPAKLIKKQSDLETPELDTALNYIATYQWNEAEGPLTPQKVEEYTKNVQKALGLKPTGSIDHQLVKMMEHTPRCGLPDYAMADGPQAAKWGLSELTYFVEQYVEGLSKTDQDAILAKAWSSWSNVANLKFTRVNTAGKANFVISTGRGRGSNFDGPGNTLAWAYLPSGNSYQGQLLMRFDLDERWLATAGQRGILMENVACHEFGHLLGLDHSRISTALMAPYYSPNVPKPVDNDDVKRIVALYGRATAPTPLPTPTPTGPATKYTVTIKVSDLSDIKIDNKPVTDFKLIS